VNARKFGFCAEMTVRYHHPANPGEPLTATAELVADRRGRVLEAKAALHNPAGVLVAGATGKYMPIRDADLQELKRDLVGDLEWLLPN
jgi:acyl-coenzyme A thioesterase PaaI-like protein